MEAAVEVVVVAEGVALLVVLVGLKWIYLGQRVRQSMGRHGGDLEAPIAAFLFDVVEGGPHSELSDGPLKRHGVPELWVEQASNFSVVLPPAF